MFVFFCVCRRMERLAGVGVIPLAVGAVGLLMFLRMIQKARRKQVVQDKVVVITGASSGLGKGKEHRPKKLQGY